MGINGLLTDVRWEWMGTEVTTDLVAGTTVLPVLDPESITADESVWIADTGPYDIASTDVDASTFTLTSGLQIDVDSGTEVARDVGGQPGRAWVCEVVLADAEEPIEVPLTVHDLSVMPEGYYDPPVVIVLADDLGSVEDLPGSLPVVDGVYIPPESLPPGPQGVPGPPGVDGAPQYTWVKYADSPTTGMSDDPTGKVYMGLSYNHDDPTESSNYGDYQWSKVQGDPGPPAGVVDLTSNTQVLTQPAAGGVTVPATAVVTGTASNTTISVYEYSVDGTPFSGTVPAGVSRTGNVVTITGAAMVAKSITVRMADAVGISDSLSVARVQEGAGGAPGPQGEPGVGVSGTTVTYQVGSSGTSAPTGAWVSTPPATTPGTFLWTRTITTYSDASTSTAYSVAAHGTTGLPGSPGAPGTDGSPGAPGRGISSTAVTYQIGTSGTTAPTGAWSPTPIATTPGDFLWTRTVTTYTDATTSTAYSVAVHGATGTPGAPGSPGNPGAPGVGVTGTAVTYQVGSSGTSAPTGAWSSSPQATTPGTFLWTRTVTTYSDASTSTAYSVAAHGTTGTSGSPGSPGSPGVGVSSTAVTYQAGSSGTTAPTGTWVGSPPATSPGQFLWTRTITTYTDTTTNTAYSVAAQGTPGNPGADAYTLVLSNEAHTFPGSTTAALAGSTTTVLTALKGAAAINASINNAAITGAPTGMTTAVTGSPGTPTVTITVTTALVALNGVLTIPVVVDGFTFNKIFSWSVSRQGTQGTPGTPGADGTPRYTWTKYADNATGTVGFSDVPTATSKYLGMAYNQLTLTESNVPGDYQWSLIQGPQGPTGPQGTPGSATNGLPPTTSVTNLTVIGGIGALYVRWTPISNPDPVTYDLHVSPTSGFTPSASTLVVSTMATSHSLRALPTAIGDPPSISLNYDTDYYFKVIARDADPGTGPTSPQAWAQIIRVTGPDVAAESITGDRIQGGTITGDLLSSTVVMGSTISTGGLDDSGHLTGARVDLGPDGITTYAPDGITPIVNFPLDPADDAFIHNAHVSLLSADVKDNLTVYGTNNELAASSTLQLGSGTTSPSTPPTLASSYDIVQLNLTPVPSNGGSNQDYNLGTFGLDPSQITSMCWDPVYSCWQVFQQKSTGFRLWRFNADGSFRMNPLGTAIWVDDYRGMQRVTGCRNGWLQQWTDGKWYAWETVTSGGTGNRWGIIPNSWLLSGSPTDPVMSFDEGAQLSMLCQNDSYANDTFRVRRFHTVPYVGGQIQNAVSDGDTTSMTGIQRAGDTAGVYYGPADFGGNRYVTASGNYTRAQVWTPSTRYNGPANFAEWEWATLVKAFGYDGSNFWSVDAGGKMYKYSGWTWPTEPSTTWVGMSAYDSDATGGTHETPVGTLANRNAVRRSKLTITVPATQDSGGTDDPDQWRVYWARTSGAVPTASLMHLVTGLGSPTLPTSVTMQTDSTGANPPGGIYGQVGAVNTFPAGNPAKILDGVGNVMIDAKGHGSVGLTGEVRMYGGAAAPVGWLMCDGSSLVRTAYPDLFAILGTTFGKGSDSPVGTTFNLPDMRSRFPAGAGLYAAVGGSEAGVPGVIAGTPPAESVARQDRMSHSHDHGDTGNTGSGHSHTIPNQAADTAPLQGGTGSGSPVRNAAYGGHNHGGSTTGSGGHTHNTISASALPSGTVHAFTAFNFIIRT